MLPSGVNNSFKTGMFRSKHKKSTNALQFFILVSALIACANSFNFRELAVNSNSYIIDTVTTYTIVYDRTINNNA